MVSTGLTIGMAAAALYLTVVFFPLEVLLELFKRL
jgi:hypothetical protein